jgi:hypothetical protein
MNNNKNDGNNKRNQIALLAVAGLSLVLAGTTQQAYGQYGIPGNPTANVTDEQLAECEAYEIQRSECNEHTLLAARKAKIARENPTGSGTALLTIDGNQTWIFVGVLGAIFGGVAAAFFAKGRAQ